MTTAPEEHHARKAHRTIPAWVILAIGVVVTGGALIWSSGLTDATGQDLLDETTAKVLIALLGTAGTVLSLVLQRTSEVRHQVKNSHGTNFRDDLDDARSEIGAVKETAEHAVRAARKASDDTGQLREDVQALRSESASDIRGLRKDIGRLTDIILNSKETS